MGVDIMGSMSVSEQDYKKLVGAELTLELYLTGKVSRAVFMKAVKSWGKKWGVK